MPYRRWWPQSDEDLVGPALVSGLLQALLFLLSFFAGYFAHMQARFELLAGPVMDVGTADNGAAGLGLVLMADYLIRPTTILVLYLCVEGTARAFSALISREPLGHFPLHALNLILKALQYGCLYETLGWLKRFPL